jgi:hypothetical protein
MSPRVARRAVVAALVIVGFVGLVGPGATGATFTDAHDGTGNVTAADDFGKRGPTADAGGPYAVDEGDSVTLDGTGSTGGQWKLSSYTWQIVGGGPGSLTNANTATPTYHAPSDVNGNTDVTVELTVTDKKGNSDTDTATVTVRDVGSADAPSVDSLTVTKTGKKNRKFSVDADVSDPTGDGNKLDTVTVEAVRTKQGSTDYSTTIQVSGHSASIGDTTAQLKNKKQYEIVVTVTDTAGNSASASRTRTTG